MFTLFFTNPLQFFISFGGLLLSLTIHEFAHAWTADRLGDPTPRMQGRVTLNPLAHLDLIGTIALLLTRFGWGKPVEIDPYNLKNPLRDSALIALAGPATNLTVALLLTIILRALQMPDFLAESLIVIITINVVLAVFNLVPVHPLDGSKIILPLLPKQTAYEYETFMHQYGIYVLLALLIPWYNGSSPMTALIQPVITFIAGLLFS